VREVVVSGDTSNPRGGLDYVYQISVTKGTVASLVGSSFASFLTDVGQNRLSVGFVVPFVAGTQGADNATRSLDGSSVNFNFVPALTTSPFGAGVSYVLFVLTNSQAFGEGVIGIVDSANSSTGVGGFAPAFAGVPEPSSLIIMASCFLSVVGAYAWLQKGQRHLETLYPLLLRVGDLRSASR